eukprot:Amastigsp_a517457_20.p5 type:complete len:114 gc:universal Amastigsp_a517457_20:1110-1451(+)
MMTLRMPGFLARFGLCFRWLWRGIPVLSMALLTACWSARCGALPPMTCVRAETLHAALMRSSAQATVAPSLLLCERSLRALAQPLIRLRSLTRGFALRCLSSTAGLLSSDSRS